MCLVCDGGREQDSMEDGQKIKMEKRIYRRDKVKAIGIGIQKGKE